MTGGFLPLSFFFQFQHPQPCALAFEFLLALSLAFLRLTFLDLIKQENKLMTPAPFAPIKR